MAYSVLRFDMRAPAFSPATSSDLYAAALDMASWADEHGFHSVSLPEHHGVEDGFLPSPLALAGCFVGRTRSIEISINALLLPLYDPIKLAEDLAVLDLASQGRVRLTLGMGYRPDEYAMFGKDWSRRGQLMDECIEALLRAWSGEAFEYQGRSVRMTPRPFSGPLPPVNVGGSGPHGARRAARFGLPFLPATADEDVLELYLSECERLGVAEPDLRPPGSGEMIWVAHDPDSHWEEIGPYLLHEASEYRSWQRPGHRSGVLSHATTALELKAEGKYCVLTPEQCIERAKAAGPDVGFVLYPLCGGLPPELAWQSLKLYAGEVLPHIE
jgi:alkanesulfonate monooxygenase SsuD/methylene tetrahydromethanopterin reductase-like flavin-dependent oxidoreductase (luciferase family)